MAITGRAAAITGSAHLHKTNSGGNATSGSLNTIKPDGQHSRIPVCLKRLVRSIVRTFYAREHSMIVDMLVRNTIMKEDDICERLRFERKQLRQFLHTLKTDQFIKTKLQLETDTDSKTTKITHYFIDYKLFVNVVKYRLDQMQRRLEAGQRQSGNRTTFKCLSCATAYTDLEVDRLLDISNPGSLVCVYCRAEVAEEAEEQDCALRTDARALVAKFHRQIRDPIDNMLRECDEIHLSSSILEPEIRPLEPLDDPYMQLYTKDSALGGDINRRPDNDTPDGIGNSASGPSEGKVRIVLSDSSSSQLRSVKQRPIWLVDSTVATLDTSAGGLDRSIPSQGNSNLQSSHSTISATAATVDSQVTQTLTPGRVPTGTSNHSAVSASTKASTGEGINGETSATGITSSNSGTPSGDIMQMLLVHERRSAAMNATPKPTTSVANVARGFSNKPSSQPQDNEELANNDVENQEEIGSGLSVGGRLLQYHEITPSMVKTMTPSERVEYVRVGKQLYVGVMYD